MICRHYELGQGKKNNKQTKPNQKTAKLSLDMLPNLELSTNCDTFKFNFKIYFNHPILRDFYLIESKQTHS